MSQCFKNPKKKCVHLNKHNIITPKKMNNHVIISYKIWFIPNFPIFKKDVFYGCLFFNSVKLKFTHVFEIISTICLSTTVPHNFPPTLYLKHFIPIGKLQVWYNEHPSISGGWGGGTLKPLENFCEFI